MDEFVPLTLEELFDPEVRQRQARATIECIQELHRRILARRNGVPIDVDSVLDELRGREAAAALS